MSTRKNTLYNMGYRVFSILLPLATAPYLSRAVGREGVGLYGYAWSISEIFVLIGMLGLENYGVRAIARVRDDRDALNHTFSEIWRMQRWVAGCTLCAWLIYALLIAGEEQTIALHLTMMSVSCLVNLDWCLMGLDQFKPVAIRNTCVKLAAAAAVFLFVRTADDLWIYAMAWSVATLAGCLLCWPTLRGRVSVVRVSWRDAARHLRPCALLLISVLAVRIYRTMDKVMVGAIAGMAENGLYDNAEKVIYCLSGFISAIGTVLMPKIAHLTRQGDMERVRRHMGLSMEVLMCMTSAMAFGLAAVANEFAPLFYGQDFAFSGKLMIPLGFTLIWIGFANVIRTQWVLPQGRDNIVVVSVCCGAGVNLLVNCLVIPHLGAVGAVVGTLLAELTVPVVQSVFLRKELPYGQFLRCGARYAAIGLVMLGAVTAVKLALPWNGWLGLGIQVVIGAAVYGGLCLALWRRTGRQDMLRLLRLRR